MSFNYVIGGAAIAGATYYVYQQRQQQLDTWQNRPVRVGEGVGQKTGRKLDESFDTVTQKTNETINWTGDKLQDIKGTTKDKFYDAKKNTQEGLTDTKEAIVGAGEAAKDTLGSWGSTAKEKTLELNDSIANSVDASKAKAEKSARGAVQSLEGWGETASQLSKDYYDDVAGTAEEHKNKLWNWGLGKKRETQESIDRAYIEAESKYNEAVKQFNETKGSWFSWGDAKQKELHQQAEYRKKEAQKTFDEAKSKLEEWKKHVAEQKKRLSQDADSANKFFAGELLISEDGEKVINVKKSNRFYNWLRNVDVDPSRVSRLADNTRYSVRGFGENATFFANEEVSESRAPSEAAQEASAAINRKIRNFKEWANKQYAATAQGAEDYYHDSARAVEEAQKQIDDNTSHWYSWGKKKNDQLAAEGRENLEIAKSRLKDSQANLSKWSKDTAASTIDTVKDGLNTANDKAQSGLNKANSWVKS